MNRNIVRIVKRRQARRRCASRIRDSRSSVLEVERTVNSWVDEGRSKHATESRIAFSKLFGNKSVL
jgi:hypothetical protein